MSSRVRETLLASLELSLNFVIIEFRFVFLDPFRSIDSSLKILNAHRKFS